VKVGLVLSGGAAYGFAHIGVIKTLLKHNIPIDVIAGTSMGALVGGVYAAGVSVEEMEKTLQGFSRKHIVDFNPFVLTDTGLLYGKKVSNFLRKLVGDKKIEDCDKKYCAIASDLYSGKKYVFKKGDLVTAIRASISIPVIFKPVKIDKMCLIDGGAHDNLPVKDARKLGADVVISIDVCSAYQKPTHVKNAVEVAFSAVNMMVANLVNEKEDKGDIYIKINQPGMTPDKFSEEYARKSVAYGEKYTKRFIPKIKEVLGLK